jgi:hypothetical protein
MRGIFVLDRSGVIESARRIHMNRYINAFFCQRTETSDQGGTCFHAWHVSNVIGIPPPLPGRVGVLQGTLVISVYGWAENADPNLTFKHIPPQDKPVVTIRHEPYVLHSDDVTTTATIPFQFAAYMGTHIFDVTIGDLRIEVPLRLVHVAAVQP